MNSKGIFIILSLAIIVSFQSVAKTKTKKAAKTGITLLEAWSQKTVPGIPRVPPRTNYHFIAIWEGANYPETIFWRGENGWENCNIAKAHKIIYKAPEKGKKQEYNTEIVTADKIHRGDTLQLVSIPGGKFPVPAEIPADAKNTLFYKTGGSGWLSCPVKAIEKKQDIIMQ